MCDPALVIPIHPQYAEAILDGRKRYELRRVLPNVPAGTTVYIYATAPVSGIIGRFKAGPTHVGSKAGIWASFSPDFGVSRAEYDRYFRGKLKALALTVEEPQRLRRPAALSELRAISDRAFFAPQSSLWLRNAAVAEHLESLTPAFAS